MQCLKMPAVILLILAILGCAAAGCAEAGRSSRQIVEEMAVYYGTCGSLAKAKVQALLDELRSLDPAAAEKWRRIMALWQEIGDLPIHMNTLPDGLPDTDALCIVALGFQLNPDGSMQDELIERLKVTLACAQKYPNALIVCTGGGTASDNDAATEAGKMAEWLISHGVDPARVIVEDRSLTTAQNAIFTLDILEKSYPQVKRIAIVSSDYHIATGTLVFEAEAILRSHGNGQPHFSVVSNAAWPASSTALSAMFQAGALIELSSIDRTAYDIHSVK